MASTQTKDEPKAKLHDTRQLLNELDALMDQMLALPINEHYEDEMPAAPAQPEPATSAPATVSATLTMLDAPAAEEQPAAQQTEQQPADDDAEPSAPRYETSPESTTSTAEPIPVPVLADVADPPKIELDPLPAPVASAPWRPDHISYQFLLWVNQRYDSGTLRFGKPGKLLRSRAVRMLLGLAGLGLLGLAAAWLANDWLGWN